MSQDQSDRAMRAASTIIEHTRTDTARDLGRLFAHVAAVLFGTAEPTLGRPLQPHPVDMPDAPGVPFASCGVCHEAQAYLPIIAAALGSFNLAHPR